MKIDDHLGRNLMCICYSRKGAEMNIRKSSRMTEHVAVLNNHSDAVGEASYNLADYTCRAQYVNAIASSEGSSQLPAAAVGDETRRQEREEEDQRFAKERANIILNRDKQRRNNALSSQTRVKRDHREFFQKLITAGTDLEVHKKTRQKFPGKLLIKTCKSLHLHMIFLVDNAWKKILYRLIDSNVLLPPDLDKVTTIEQEVFLNIKPEVEKELDREWRGDKEQNSLADFKVAQSFKRSFVNYEKSRGDEDIQYFKF